MDYVAYAKKHKFVDVRCDCVDRRGVQHRLFLGSFQADTKNLARYYCIKCNRIHILWTDDDLTVHRMATKEKIRFKNISLSAVAT